MNLPGAEHVRGARRRRLWPAGLAVVTVLGVIALTFYLIARFFGLLTPDAAVEAALLQYRQVSGIQDLQLEVTSGWSDCAIVQVGSASSEAGAVLAMVKGDDGQWRIARKSDEQATFDTDDIRDHDSCLEVAQSSGSLTNGTP